MVSNSKNDNSLQFIEVGDASAKRQIAVRLDRASERKKPGLVWLGGYRSDMLGTKAEALRDFAAENGMDCLRLDYSGHGESGGEFRQGTISRWLEESLAVFDQFATGAQILVGSSMGGWTAIRLAQELEKRGQGNKLHALLLLAPAPDFTSDLIWPRLGEKEKLDLQEKGYFEEFSEYSDEPNIFTRELIEDGAKNSVFSSPIDLACPVHILQGMEDPDVPWQHAMKLAEYMANTKLAMTIVRDGDHRLSRDEDIARMLDIVSNLASAPGSTR